MARSLAIRQMTKRGQIQRPPLSLQFLGMQRLFMVPGGVREREFGAFP
jgi:hypothetical protein